MSATLLTEPLARTADQLLDDSPFTHLVCCDEDTSMCGVDLAGGVECPESEADCIVCLDLAGAPCGAPDCPYGGAL